MMKNIARFAILALVLGAWGGAAGAASDSDEALGRGQGGRAPAASRGESSSKARSPTDPLSLWYRRPAAKWTEALPVGNGRLGAMVFGKVGRERLQLNEDTLWAGGPYDPSNPEALEALPEARRLIFAGKHREAFDLIGKKMMAKPLRQMPYQPLGDLFLEFGDLPAAKDYRRELSLREAIARTTFLAGGTRFTREVFASPADQVIAVRLLADKPGAVSFTARFLTPHKGALKVEGRDTLVFDGVNPPARGVPGALRFEFRMKAVAEGGRLIPQADALRIEGADAATLLIAAATSYRSYNDVSGDPAATARRRLARAAAASYAALRRRHIAEHRRLFDRLQIDLGPGRAALPTDERIRRFSEGGDPALAALYCQFGRYLLISSSRPGSQPANLQGIWNDKTNPPWDSKYTININTEMNYWPAEPGNLPECVEPLVRMVEDLSHTGARTAKVMWGARGWVTHHNTDLWRATAPIDGPFWGFWPTGGAWLSLHLWDHFDYNGDTNFLVRVYPVLKGSARFFLDTLVEEPQHHWLVTCPSLSPENATPYGVSVCAGPTMDMQILRDLFAACIRAGEILGVDEPFRRELAQARARLAPNQIGRAGQLQEWLEDWDLQAPERHHRHVSHLYGLYPSSQIDLRRTPALAAAARKSLELRGDNATGWGLAWRLNLWARLHEGDHAWKILQTLISPSRTYPNMFDSCPPFQIDGNFGGAAGILNMAMQSLPPDPRDPEGRYEIEFLPALPKAWPEGRISGLRARGGFDAALAWREGRLVEARVRSRLGRPCRLRWGERVRDLDLKPGESFLWRPAP